MGGLYRRYLLEVLQHTTVQGCVHLTYRTRHPLERVVWALFLATAIGCTVATCLSTWNRYRTNPTSVSMTHDYNEWLLDFPASYVCPSSKVDPESLNITSARLAGENASEERQQRVADYLRAVANASPRRLGALRRFAGDRSLPQSDLLQLVLEVKFNFSHKPSNVPPLGMTLLEEGVCYYSNARVALLASPLPKSTLRFTFDENARHVQSTAFEIHEWLHDIFGIPSDKAEFIHMYEKHCVFVSSPDEIPNMMSAGHSAMQLSQLIMSVGVLPMSATEALLSLRVEQRRCRQAHESPLGISPDYYTYGLCRLQCRIDLATKLCGCVPYFYPRQAGQKECDIKGMVCLHEHEEEMVTLPEGLTDCHCLPRCSERHYYPLDYKLLDNDNLGGAALYRWSVTQFPRVNLRKDVLFTFVDLLVSFGGAASFFMGCSILSLVELVYYMTLRLYFYRRAALNRLPRRA
ncbi:uncharacterized protein LOC126108113 [Schistocerca cancellata]|uniref:uncharacterized protein LOC126108113 n=1 Tax=Schistocerca cancellata TaxID=274614 RepID=UPI0021192A08|nr:uncharacterized protein LOC126108113 [Schistocerca cancellata]